MIQVKFALNWPSGFRGEDFWKSLQTDAGRQVMAIPHMRWAKKERPNQKQNLPVVAMFINGLGRIE
jgi:hypothetical protein